MKNIFYQTRHCSNRKNVFLIGLSRFSVLLLLFGYCALIFPSSLTAAESPGADKTKTDSPQTGAPPPSAPQPAKPSAPAVHPITQAAVKAGVLSCASLINKVIAFLTANSKNGAYLFFPRVQPDQSIFSASLEVQSQNATPTYASASFAPLTSGRVGAIYDKVEYVPKSCAYVEKNIFKNLKRSGVLKKDIIMLDAGPVKIFLMPAGTGCVVIKKEVVE